MGKQIIKPIYVDLRRDYAAKTIFDKRVMKTYSCETDSGEDINELITTINSGQPGRTALNDK